MFITDTLTFITDALNYFSWGYLFQEKGYTSGEMLIKELSQHSPCRTLIQTAQNVIQELGLAALEVRFEPIDGGFYAQQNGNVIIIDPNLNAAVQRFNFIFELTNVIQHKKHIAIWNSAVKGSYKNAEEYARAVEFIEYKGLKYSSVVSRIMNKQNGRFFRPYLENPFESRWISIESMDFNLYYSSYLWDSHKEYYRKAWRNLNNIQNSTISIFNNTLNVALSA